MIVNTPMATAERPPAKIDGKPNPAYQKWYRDSKKPAPATLAVRGLKTLPNPAWVLATHPTKEGSVIEVEVRRGHAKQFVNKEFRVTLNDDGTAKHAPEA